MRKNKGNKNLGKETVLQLLSQINALIRCFNGCNNLRKLYRYPARSAASWNRAVQTNIKGNGTKVVCIETCSRKLRAKFPDIQTNARARQTCANCIHRAHVLQKKEWNPQNKRKRNIQSVQHNFHTSLSMQNSSSSSSSCYCCPRRLV